MNLSPFPSLRGLSRQEIVIYDPNMAISITEFKAKCLKVIRQVEVEGQPIEIVRRGRVVARLVPAVPTAVQAGTKPWQRLRGTGSLDLAPHESVLHDTDFDALG